MPIWFSFLQILCAAGAGLIWFLFPSTGVAPLALGLIPWALRLLLARRLPLTPFAAPFLLFLATAALSVWTAYDTAVAWAKFWLIVGALLLFYAFAHFQIDANEQLSDTRQASLVAAWLLGGLGVAIALYFISTHDWNAAPAKLEALTALGQRLQVWTPPFAVDSLNPNVAGGSLALSLPFAGAALYQSWHDGKRRRRTRLVPILISGVMLAIVMLGLLLTTSRGAWLAVIAALAIAATWVLAGKLLRSRLHWRRYVLALLLLVGLLFTVGLIIRAPEIIVAALERLPGPNGLRRLDLYRNSLILVQDYPLAGAGLGGFMMLYSTYSFMLHVGFIAHAHNLFLDVAIEQGLPGLAALVWIAALAVIAIWRSASDGRIHPLSGAAALSVLIIFLHGLVDDPLYGSRTLLFFFVPLAPLVSPLQAWHSPHSVPATAGRLKLVPSHLLPGVLLIAVFLAAAILSPRRLQSLMYANLGAVTQSRAELAVYNFPEWRLQDQVRRDLDLAQVIAYYEQALALDPNNASANRRLGQIELSLGAYDQARQHLLRAYQATPWDNGTRQLAGEALIVTGDVQDGATLWSDVHNGQRQLDARLFWYQHIKDSQRLSWVKSAMEGQ